ncbi:MAG: DUF1415 domain-containing protein [Pseudomonadota bacterium]
MKRATKGKAAAGNRPLAAHAGDDTLDWVERVVVGLNLCPFAAPVLDGNTLDVVVSDASDDESLLADLDSELTRLCRISARELETTLLVFTHALGEFDAFLEFADIANALLASRGLDGIVQLASFHPRYVFAGSDPADPTNATNRSPWPMLHLLREDSVAMAIASHPDTAMIPEANKRKLAAMDAAQLRMLVTGQPDT